MITIYDKNNVVRVKLNVNDGSAVQAVYSEEDAVLNQEISNEEFVSIRITSVTFIAFQVGDYLEAYGNTYRLKKIPAPIDKNGSNRFEYTLKFESNRADLAEVNLQLFDNTTVEVVPAYNPSTTYSSGDVVSYHTLHWQYINSTPSNGNVPSENDYWALKSTVTNYVPAYAGTTTYTYGDIVDYNNNYYMHIGATDTVGVKPIEGEHWTVVKTAPQWDFSTILTPTRYAQLVVDNMNRARPNQTWTVGYCIPAEPKETTFSNVKCLDACASIAELFETEFWIDGYSLNFGKRANTTNITMGYGKGNGFKKITRNEVTESRKVTRLIALGGERNLPGTYRNGSKRLMLPDKYYLDADNIDLTSPLEDTQMWDDIIPTIQHATEDYNNATTYYVGNQVLYGGYSWDCITQCTGVTPSEGTYWKYSEGTVTTYVGQYKFIDKNITFDPLGLDVRMKDGTIPKVKFLTGNLAGYEFPITGYNNTTKQITIEQISDSTDSLLPTPSYGFKVGDRFCFVDLYMPSTYIPKAQMRLLAKAQDYLNKYSVDQVSYAGEVDEIWAKNNAIELRIGDIIHFNDTDFGISLDYRIVKLTRNLTRPYKYTVELSTLPYIPSKITTITNKINQNETYIQYNGLNTKMSKSKTFLGAREAIDMAFDPSGFYFTDKIRPLIVETSALLVGTEQQQYQITDLGFRTHSSNPNLIEWGIGTIIDSSIGGTARTWNIASGSFTATDNSQAYYGYIRCERAVGSTSAIVLFDTVQHLTEEGNDYYFFLLGTLSSVRNGMRQLYTSKGFTFINGDTIVTGTIQSESGETYLDLKNGITHIGSTEKYIDYRDGEFKIKGNLVVSPSGIEFPMPCFRGEYNITYVYYKGDTVLYNGSTWIYVNATPASGITPVEGAYWNLYSKKGDNGTTGPQGVAGPAGSDGVTYYTWIRYADTSVGGGISNDPTGKLYIGFAYNKTTATESNIPSDYIWSLIKGDKGDTGATGLTGADGITYYTWIKYSDYSDGTELYDTPTSNTQYIGIAVNKTTPTESTVKTDYTWSKFKGDAGITPVTIQVTGKNIFKYPKNSTTPENVSVILTANVQGLTSPDYEWGYVIDNTFTSWDIYTQTKEVDVSALGTGESLKVRCYTNGRLQYDDYTLYKLYDGTDTINVILSNESHTVACDKDGTPKTDEISKTMTNVNVYRGSTLLTFGTQWTIHTYTYDGGEFIAFNNTIYLSYFLVGSSSAYCDITISIGGLYVTKRFTVAKSIDGVTYYTWIRYADTSVGGGISNDPTGKLYIGFAYNKTTATESNIPSDYIWSLIKGDKGDTGTTGLTGADGITYYTWIKYSDYSDGTGLYDTPTSNTQYIGIAVNKTTPTESTVKTDYTWSKFKGDAGVTGNYFENRYAVNGSNSTPPSIVVTDIVPSGWSTTLPIQGLMEYTWVTTAEKTSSGALVTNWSTPQRITGIQGATGANGPAQSYWGVWDSSKSYVGTDIIVNVVKYNSAYYISRIDAGIIPAGTLPTNTTYWNVYGSTFEAIATGLLLAENAWIGNLIVSRLGTSANPYAARFANVGTGIGIFKNLDDENDIDNVIIGMGKDISITQQAGERKPAFVVRDKQWRGTYSSTRIYYKDDRVYYSPNLGAAAWSSSTTYYTGYYVTYNNTVWICTANNSGNEPYIGSSYWSVSGETFIFTKEWLETDTPSAGYLPTNFSYWQFLGSGNLGGGKYSELGSEGVFSNGSNISGITGVSSNFSAVYLLQKRNYQANGISAAVLGLDQTDEKYGQSKSYGGYFNSAYIGRVVNNVRNVSVSGAILKSDYRIHCYGSSAITLYLPTPDNSMVGQTIVIRKIGTAGVTITTSSSYPIWHTSEITSITPADNDSLSFTWDGNYWVTYFTNQY